jgi:SHS2 domain-containing protein
VPAPRYELLEHTADLAVRVRGATLGELLANLAWAMVDLMADAAAVEPRETRPLVVRAASREELVVAWANEILFHFETERLLLPWVENSSVSESDTEPRFEARATARGEGLDPSRHGWKTELKSATYHELAVHHEPGGKGWCAVVVVDV